MNKTSRGAVGLGWLSTGLQVLSRKPIRVTGFGLAARVLLGGLCATIVAPAAWANSELTLHSFDNGSGGANPYAGLIFDGAGNLYGTTHAGGTSNSTGTVFELSPTPGGYTGTLLYGFSLGSGGDHPGYAGVIFDSAGNLYGTTANGGASSAGTVFELSPATGGGYTETVLHTFGGGNDGFTPEAGLIFDSAGNLYGTTIDGGTSHYGTVFELSPVSGGGYAETVLYSFSGGSDGAYPYAGLVLDGAGNLYGTTSQLHTSSYGTVFELSPASGGGYTETVLHNFNGGSDGAFPFAGVILDSTGNLYGTTTQGGNSGFGTAFELSPASGSYTVLHSFSGGSDGESPQGGLMLDSSGNLYGTTSAGGNSVCSNQSCGTVFKLSPASGGGYTETVLYSFTGGSDGGIPYAGLIPDSVGNLYGTTAGGGTSNRGVAFEILTTITFPTTYNFGDVATGNSRAATLTVKVGSATAISFSNASLSGANSADFSIGANKCTGTIAAGKSCMISVTFTPSAAVGTVESATLSLTDSASGMPQTIALSGTSSAQMTLSPISVNFDDVAAGTTSAQHSISIMNHQSIATSLATAIGGANGGDFAVSGGTCSTSLKAFGSCTVLLTFTPSAAVGTAESASLSITDDAASSPQVIPLSGTSSAQVTVTPTSAAFGVVTVGNTSANHTITIENHQPSAISLSTAITGADPTDFAQTGGTCGSSLKAFGSCTVILDFSPGATGNRSATLGVTDSPDNKSPHSIVLSGKGG